MSLSKPLLSLVPVCREVNPASFANACRRREPSELARVSEKDASQQKSTYASILPRFCYRYSRDVHISGLTLERLRMESHCGRLDYDIMFLAAEARQISTIHTPRSESYHLLHWRAGTPSTVFTRQCSQSSGSLKYYKSYTDQGRLVPCTF